MSPRPAAATRAVASASCSLDRVRPVTLGSTNTRQQHIYFTYCPDTAGSKHVKLLTSMPTACTRPSTSAGQHSAAQCVRPVLPAAGSGCSSHGKAAPAAPNLQHVVCRLDVGCCNDGIQLGHLGSLHTTQAARACDSLRSQVCILEQQGGYCTKVGAVHCMSLVRPRSTLSPALPTCRSPFCSSVWMPAL